MARLFILFLIVLLPLRGWTAERMVFQRDSGTPAATVSQGVQAAMGEMGEDCALHMQMAAQPGSATEPGVEHKGCQSCQLCMPLAALDAAVNAAFTPIPQAVPLRHASTFVSADAARHAKPPIS